MAWSTMWWPTCTAISSPPGARRDGWQDFLARLAHGVRQIALDHPELFPLVATRPPEAPWVRPAAAEPALDGDLPGYAAVVRIRRRRGGDGVSRVYDVPARAVAARGIRPPARAGAQLPARRMPACSTTRAWTGCGTSFPRITASRNSRMRSRRCSSAWPPICRTTVPDPADAAGRAGEPPARRNRRSVDRGHELMRVDRLGDVGVRVQLVTAPDVLLGRRRGQHHDRDPGQIRIGFDLCQDLAAVVLGQIQIEQDQIRPRRVSEGGSPVQEVQGLLAVAHDMQGMADPVVLEGLPCHQLIAGIVLDEQHVDGLAGPVILLLLGRFRLLAWRFRSRILRLRQGEAQPGALGVRGVDPDPAAVLLDDLLAQGQADTGAAVFVAAVQALEDHEHLVVELGGRCRCHCRRPGAPMRRNRRAAVDLDDRRPPRDGT